MFKITAPGIFPDCPTADYFADPCPAPSLTQSVAKILLEQSPLHAWHAHPRLNPDYRHDDDRKFDVGNIAHALLLGRGKSIVVLEFDDWRTKAAKEARDEAAAAGKLGVLGKHFAKADRMVKAAREQLEQRELGHLFTEGNGNGEIVTAWQEGNIWLRQMIDWLTPDMMTFADYKTTDMSVAPHLLGRQMVTAGWPIQAAMALRGLRLLSPEPKGICRFYFFIVQETAAPYCLNVVEIGEGPLVMGGKMLDTAVERWRACMKADRWPGYPAEIVTPELPGWFEQQWLDREIHEAAQSRVPTENILMAG